MPLPRSSWYSAGFFWYKSSLWHSAGCATRVRIEPTSFCLCVAMGSALMACESGALWIRFRGWHGTTFGSTFCGRFTPFCSFKGRIDFYVGATYWRVAGSWLGLECIENFCFDDWGTTTHKFTIVATNGWDVFWQQKMYKDRPWMWNIICKALLGHGSCTSGCCATRTFRWVYDWNFSMLLSLQSPVLQPVTEYFTQGTCEGTTLKCEKCCVAWSLRLWELIGRRLGMRFCTCGTHA